MFAALFDFALGWLVTSSAVNTRRTARNTAALVEMASMTETQKVERAKREQYLAGQRRFVYILFGVIVAIAWAASALTGH